MRLLWNKEDVNGEYKAIIDLLKKNCNEEVKQFDTIIACDCLFFKDFHYELIHTIDFMLKPNGKAYFLQPLRYETMNLFLMKLKESNKFTFELIENYNEKVKFKFILFLSPHNLLYIIL